MNDYRMVQFEVYREDIDDFQEFYEVQKFIFTPLGWATIYQSFNKRAAREYMKKKVLEELEND